MAYKRSRCGWVSCRPFPRKPNVNETLGLLAALPLLFLVAYLVFVKLSQLLGGDAGHLGGFAAA